MLFRKIVKPLIGGGFGSQPSSLTWKGWDCATRIGSLARCVDEDTEPHVKTYRAGKHPTLGTNLSDWTPAVAWNALASRYGLNVATRVINSVQIGSAEGELLTSSRGCHHTQSNALVNPANQPSCEVPVLPAAGSVRPRERTRRRQDIADYAHHEIRHACVECGASFPAPLTDDHTIGSAYECNRHGLTRTFWLANAVQAEAISSGVDSYAPSAAAGVGFIASCTPARCAIAT